MGDTGRTQIPFSFSNSAAICLPVTPSVACSAPPICPSDEPVWLPPR